MFNQIASLITTALTISGVALAAPASNHELASPNIQVCTGNVLTGTGCVTIPVSADSCINFTGGLSFLNDEVSTASIPGGLVCTFFDQFGCLSDPRGADVVVLQGGNWGFIGGVPGTAGTVNFNDRTSSIICSPV